MFNLNENNQFLISNAPTDMRVGVNAMCGKVRQAGGDPTDGKVYVFVGKTRKVMKLLHWERGGYVMYLLLSGKTQKSIKILPEAP